MKSLFLGFLVVGGMLVFAVPAEPAAQAVPVIVNEYIEQWKGFNPSQARSRGFVDVNEGFEDLSEAAITAWVDYNQATLARLEALSNVTRDDRIDRRLLRTQIRTEIDRWQNDKPQESSLKLYADLISNGLSPILESTLLSDDEKRRYLLLRLKQIEKLSDSAKSNLRDGRPTETSEALADLEGSARYIQSVLPRTVGDWFDEASAPVLKESCSRAAQAISGLVEHGRGLLPELTLPDEPILGPETYARKLEIYTDSDLTPEQLGEIALWEIETSKKALHVMAAAYWKEVDPQTPTPDDFETLVGRAFADMEANRPTTEQEYLLELRRYGQEVEDFVRDRGIATVPDHQTLSIELAPESSGPMARIGYVSSAPAFAPNPWTTWYLATIPDSHPERERIDFWRSFNYSFKRFIVIHELFPGHYMQLKILRENPHKVRILFPYRPFIEGWATFTERIVLDAGYAEGDWLTRFAQLRKRLENANRAYMSVQAHCNGWTEQQVTDFSIETSLLAPQFAKSLWGRLMSSPMQIITYMLVGLELREIYEMERERLGDEFDIKSFMDTILRTGPVPSDELAAILAARPRRNSN
jgi:uncharacterized protein (DUF885 family)